jgi:hypothetical protein
VSQLITIRMDSLHMCLSSGYCTGRNFHCDTQNRDILLVNIGLLCRGRKFLIGRKWHKNGIINTDNTEQWLVGMIRTGIIITILEFYGIMWDKCDSSVLSIVCRTHLSHFPFFANINVYEHIGHTSWDKCDPRQMCSYIACNTVIIACWTRWPSNS